jgi:hypothetical protein
MSYTISTAKGEHTGTLEDVCAWQAEMQGACADLFIEDESQPGIVCVNVRDVEFDRDDISLTIAAVEHAIALAAWEPGEDD